MWERIGDVGERVLWSLRAANDTEERRGLRLVSTQPASVAVPGRDGGARQRGAPYGGSGKRVKR